MNSSNGKMLVMIIALMAGFIFGIAKNLSEINETLKLINNSLKIIAFPVPQEPNNNDPPNFVPSGQDDPNQQAELTRQKDGTLVLSPAQAYK